MPMRITLTVSLIGTKSGLIKTVQAKAEADRKATEALEEKTRALEEQQRAEERGIDLSYLQQDLQLEIAQGLTTEAEARNRVIETLYSQLDAAETDNERKIIAAELDQRLFEDELARIEEGKQAYIEASEAKMKQDDAEMAAKQQTTDAAIGLAANLGDFLTTIAGENKGLAIAGLVVEQAAAIASIISQTAIANAKAAAASPLTAGQPFVTINTISAALSAASTIAATAKGIQQINAAGGGAVGGTAGGGGASSVPFGPSASTPRTSGTIAGDGATGIEVPDQNGVRTGETTVMAVVAQGDITNSQERAARAKRLRTFGG